MDPTTTRRLGLALLLASVAAPALSSDAAPTTTAEQVLACHIDALGGRAALDRIQDLRLEGDYTAFSQPAGFILERKRPNLYFFDTKVLDMHVIDAYDGERTWILNPLLGNDWPIEAPPAEAGRILGLASFDGTLADAVSAGHRVELAGVEDFEGTESYKLVVHLTGGGEETWFVATDTCLPVGRDAVTSDFGSALPGRTFFSEYRPVGGVQIAHHIEDEFGIRFRVTQVILSEVNIGIKDERFAFHPQPEMEPLAMLAGEWRVKVETRPAERAPWNESETTATLVSDYAGTRLEERVRYSDGLFDRHELRTLGYDRARKRFVQTVFDNVTMSPDRLEGGFETGQIVLSNADTGTAVSGGGVTQLRRHTFHDL
ncbi:MAG: DUF1579 family protein, partial [Acidobacteria bacterium]|nr:DUF1579 family protein [Acidobacteriota bacterium]